MKNDLMNLTLTTVTLPAASRVSGGGMYDKFVTERFAKSAIGEGVPAGIDTAAAAGIRKAVADYNEKNPAAPLHIRFFTTKKGEDNKPVEFGFVRGASANGKKRGPKPATPAPAAPAVSEI